MGKTQRCRLAMPLSLRKEFGSRPLQHVAFASHIIACPQTVEDGEFLGRLGRIIKE